MEIAGRVAVVTGGAAGLGEVLTRHLGATVLVVDIDGHRASALSDRLGNDGHRCVPLEADLLAAGQLEAVVRRAGELGGPHLLVNNAGGWSPTGRQYPAASSLEWRQVLELNLAVPMELTQRCRPLMARLGGGAVANVASSAGCGGAAYGSPEYAAAKAGLIRFTTAVADWHGECGVRVNTVVPDWIGLPRAHAELASLPEEEQAARPPLIPPEDVAGVVAELLGDDTASGRVVVLDGDSG
jgi:NAD(P)-dependent dehydrogenase (short-subunit alcohol dehydrogenase family)